MQSISSRVSANNQIFLNPLQMIDIHVIRDMLFPTKLTSMIYTPGLIDSASPENDHNNRRNSGSHEWPKTFLGRCILLLCVICSHFMDYLGCVRVRNPFNYFTEEYIFPKHLHVWYTHRESLKNVPHISLPEELDFIYPFIYSWFHKRARWSKLFKKAGEISVYHDTLRVSNTSKPIIIDVMST